ncbi:class I SAM-dependent methyltransferase [uncultured Campylobacter sp.]|uniref:class I SAM-dependent methyltransferase n=1 Tax=uncultured Campylobacter sp. TaxID=218934 RepID=UPI0026153B25|nr:class I SAM-dependent methyltransferase [uncultured Campylobacter sp.]
MERIGEKSHKNSWDKKSESYAKFSGEPGDFGKRVFEILRGWGVSFAGKSVLDVGAGTGVYSLYLASLGAKVTAIDSSEGMLRELRRSAEEFGISLQNVLNLSFAEFCERLSRDGFADGAGENFKIYPRSQSEISNAQAQEARALNLKDAVSKNRESENFKIPAVFDIAFLTMSPALKSTEDFEAFLALGERKIYLNWASERNSSMLAPLFERFGTGHKRLATAAEKFEALLGARDIKFKSEILTEKREQKRSLQEAVQFPHD